MFAKLFVTVLNHVQSSLFKWHAHLWAHERHFAKSTQGWETQVRYIYVYITPSGQEGGYPTVVWTLMVLHVPWTGCHVGRAAVACPSQIVTRSFVALSLWMRKARRLDCKLKFFAMQSFNVTVYCLVFSYWMWIRRADKSHYGTLKNVQEGTRNNNGNFWKSWLYQGSQNFSITYLSLEAKPHQLTSPCWWLISRIALLS